MRTRTIYAIFSFCCCVCMLLLVMLSLKFKLYKGAFIFGCVGLITFLAGVMELVR